MIFVPHFELPLRLTAQGSFRTLEQDLLPEIAQCVEVLVGTEIGERIEVPDYGVVPMLFRVDIDRETIIAQIAMWEPRVATLLEEEPSQFDALVREVRIRVTSRKSFT
ncbi:MAG: hypothetical protein ABR616_05955 [Dermatophilaceae bacterium]|nr:hypothetical protein [Intrasporangiaceae bacterium]